MVASPPSKTRALTSGSIGGECSASVNDLQLIDSRYQLTEYALEVLASNPTEQELGELFEEQQFSPSLEEYLFECMDISNSPYVEVVQEQLSKLEIQVI